MTRRLLRRSLGILSVAGWLLFIYLSATTLMKGATSEGDVFQVDWHVYWAAAHDLLSGDLYQVPLDAGGLALSTPDFNLPPLSAAAALPLLALPIRFAGYVWQAVGAGSIAVATIAALAIWRVPRPWLHGGLVAGPLALTLLYVEGLHLGTNNYLVLALVAGFAWLFLRGADAPAGALLGTALALKLWPAVLLVVALRERRLRLVAWAAGLAVIQGVVLFGWLGVDALPAFFENLRMPIPATGYLIGPSAVDGVREAWNSGVGVVIGLAILALPLRGPAGIGAAIVAGLCAIPNLWIHYGPTVLFAGSLLGTGWVSRRGELHEERSEGGQQQAVPGHQHADR
jgi:hypothetical protein